jgi:CRISPR system Cascade subunit CasE
MGEQPSDTLTIDHPDDAQYMNGNPFMYWAQVPAGLIMVPDWDDPRALHRVVMAMFPTTLPGEPHERRANAKILFRVEETVTGRAVLIQSSVKPTHAPDGSKVKQVRCGTAMTPGTLVRFRIAVNTVTRNRTQRPKGKACDLPLPEDQVDAWLADKLAGGLDQVSILASTRTVYGTDREGLKSGTVTALQVDTMDGVATVDDPDRLLELILDGVGRAKAYGCGLLTVSPIR